MSTNRGLVRVERGAKRVRVHLGGEVIADTTEPVLIWEVPYVDIYVDGVLQERPKSKFA